MLGCHGLQLSLCMCSAQMRWLDYAFRPTYTYSARRVKLQSKRGLIYIFKSHNFRQPHYLWLYGFQDVSLAAKESSAAQLEAIKIKYEEAVELRRKAESDIEAFRPVGAFQTSSIHIIKK